MESPDIFQPARLGPLTLRNRIIKGATFEGRTPQALVSDDLIAFHRQVAAGGAAMTTV
ncbi:MAG: NADH:flavin oxidoreductase, partial [Streptosporangiaceae bacterium]